MYIAILTTAQLAFLAIGGILGGATTKPGGTFLLLSFACFGAICGYQAFKKWGDK